jgi:hypothetical protein
MTTDLKIGVVYFNLMKSIHAQGNSKEYAKKLSELAEKMLKKEDWSDGRPKAEYVGQLLSWYIKYSESRLSVIKNLAMDTLPAFVKKVEEGEEGSVDPTTEPENSNTIEFGTLNNFTFTTYYKVLMVELTEKFMKVVDKEVSDGKFHSMNMNYSQIYK